MHICRPDKRSAIRHHRAHCRMAATALSGLHPAKRSAAGNPISQISSSANSSSMVWRRRISRATPLSNSTSGSSGRLL
ncbi:hypothetical protein DZA29_23385 [Citrobacter gillenii]|nr:hypothetical protein DZA29_23385 [Citrobacter gillenii]